MPDELKIGSTLYKESTRGKRAGDKVLNALQRSLNRMNKEATRRASRLYRSVFKKVKVDNSSGLIINNVENLALVREITSGLEPITNAYRVAYGDLIRTFREETFGVLAEKEQRLEFQLNKIGMMEDRKTLTIEAFEQMNVLAEKNFRKVNGMMLKWKDTVYDLFVSGVNRGMTLIDFRDSFYNKTGTIKIGSSLEEESTSAAMIAVTEQRTAFVRQKAKENNYTFCWNANPMDRLTKPVCMEASLAGVISEADMSKTYGFPPRYVCRCELVYTRPEWVGVNQGVNQAIRERRKALISDLESAPRMKSYWFWENPTGERIKVWASDPKQAAGDKMYKEIADKLKLAKSKTVPDFKKKRGGGPPKGGAPVPAPKPKPPEIKGPFKTQKHNKQYQKYYQEYMDQASEHIIIGPSATLKEAENKKKALQSIFGREYMESSKLKPIRDAASDWQGSTHRARPTALKYKAQTLEKKRTQFFTRRNRSKSDIIEWTKEIPDESYLRMKALNQVYYDALGIKKVTLYRGTDGGTGRKLAKDIKVAKEAGEDTVFIREPSLIGYTTSKSIAKSFGPDSRGISVSRRVDTKDIFISDDVWRSWKLKNDSYPREREFILLGSPKTAIKIEKVRLP
jgi:hypothetical protein